jgi:protein required for attachment to host cells
MNTVWVLVCDAARARVFEIRNEDPIWHPVGVFDHVESRSKTSALAGDHLGQRSPEGAGVHHGALAPASSPKEVEKAHFGHGLARMLEQALRARRFLRWVLVAPPQFLGMLRNELTPELAKHLMATVDKDLTHLTAHDLAERLNETVRIPVELRETLREADAHAH